MVLLAKDVRPRTFIDKRAIENAIAAVAATGGSTNAVLHLIAMAWEAGIDLSVDDFDRVSRSHAVARATKSKVGKPLTLMTNVPAAANPLRFRFIPAYLPWLSRVRRAASRLRTPAKPAVAP